MTENVTPKAHRDSGIDTLAGFFVLYIAVGHALHLYHLPTSELCPSPLLYFFMPWFFYKGGMYFKHKDDIVALKQNAKRLIKPFLLWTIIGCVVFCLLSFFTNHPIHTPITWVKELIIDGSIYENKPLWFLLSLFIVKTVSNKITPPHRGLIYLYIAAGLILATVSNHMSLHRPLWLFNSASGLVFFLIGYLIGNRYSRLFLVISIIVWISISFFIPVGVNMRSNETNYGSYYLWWIYCIAGIYSLNNIVKFIPSYILDSKYNLFRVVGVHSMEVYVIHWIILLIPITVGIL